MKIENRFYIFLAISIVGINAYQCYFNYHIDKHINHALEGHNKTYRRAVEINNELRKDKQLLQGAVDHWKAMYHATQASNHQLEEQINVISDYYRREIIKVNDELFDMKNTNK